MVTVTIAAPPIEGQPQTVQRSYTRHDTPVMIDEGGNTYRLIRADQVEVGHRVCHRPKPGPAYEVTAVEVA